MDNWSKIKPKGDPFMWGIIFILSIWGLLAIYSSTGALAYKKNGGNVEFYLFQQAGLLCFGFVLMLAIHTIHYKYFIGISKLLIWLTYPLLIYTLFMINHIQMVFLYHKVNLSSKIWSESTKFFTY